MNKRQIHFGVIGITFGLSIEEQKRLGDLLKEVARSLDADVVGDVEVKGPGRDGKYIGATKEHWTYLIGMKE